MLTSIFTLRDSEILEKVSLLLVDDQQLSNRFLGSFLNERLNKVEVDAVQQYDKALEVALRIHPTLMIVDIHLGEKRNGLQLIQEVKRMGINCKFILLTGEDRSEYIRKAILEGVSAYMSKSVTPDDILYAIDWTLNPRNKDQFLLLPTELRYLLFSDSLQSTPKPSKTSKFGLLTDTEQEVLARIGEGATVKEIAFDLKKAPTTVYTHLQNIKDKYQLMSSKELFNLALDYLLVAKSGKGNQM